MNDYKAINELEIYKKTEFAGILRRTEYGCEFELNPAFRAQSNAVYFSYCIAKDASKIVMQGDNLPPLFEETIAPESALFDRKALAGVQEKISASMITFRMPHNLRF